MKKTTLLLVIASFIASSIIAQQNRMVTAEQLKSFKTDTMYVVFDDQSMAFNVTIKNVIDKYWKLTPYKCIKYSEFDKLRVSKNRSFLLMTRTMLTKDKREIEYQYLNIIRGDTAKELNNLPEVFNIPLAYSGADDNSYTEKLPIIVRFAQKHIETMFLATNLRSYFNFKTYNKNIKKIKTKTLLIAKSDLGDDANTEKKIKEIYKYDVKIVSNDDIVKAIEKETPNTLVLFLVNPGEDGTFGRSYKMLFGADDAQLYFYNFLTIYAKQPSGFVAKDFKRIGSWWGF